MVDKIGGKLVEMTSALVSSWVVPPPIIGFSSSSASVCFFRRLVTNLTPRILFRVPNDR